MMHPVEWWYEALQVERLQRELGTLGEGTTVGIWDTGLDNRRDLIDAERAVFKDYLDPLAQAPRDGHLKRHGSLIAAIIGARADEGGIAPRCQMRIARAVDSGRQGDLRPFAPGELFSDAHIINISHAYISSDAANASIIAGFTAALAGSEKLIVAAMGNYGRAVGTLTTMPAALPSVIGVNGLARAGGLYSGSILSDHVDLVAPGNEIASPYSNSKQAGTSFSTAIIAGIACLVRSARLKRGTDASAAAVSRILLASVRPVPQDQRATHGQGPIDAEKLIANTLHEN